MLKAKQTIEDKFYESKWQKIKREYTKKGGSEQTAGQLQRFYKKMMTAEGYSPPEGIRDADFK